MCSNSVSQKGSPNHRHGELHPPQALEIAPHQLGVEKARKGGIEPGRCFAVVMVGRIDDYIRDVIHDNRIEGVEESDIIQIGTLIMNRALAIYKERGYEAVMMPAGMRGAYHAMDLSGAPIAMSIHPKIQAQLGKQAAPFATRQALEVAPDVIKRLEQVEECRRAIDPEGMVANDFISYGVVQKTLAQFTEKLVPDRELPALGFLFRMERRNRRRLFFFHSICNGSTSISRVESGGILYCSRTAAATWRTRAA